MKIPVSVIVATKNEEKRIGACLAALQDFEEIIVVDSESRDKTRELALQAGASVIDFVWDQHYPKKRQWSLEHLILKHDWILFVDADEIVTPALVSEIKNIFIKGPDSSGYFIKAHHILKGKILKHGLQNNKLILLNRARLEFPFVDDLDIPGMGEMEGHYQPVLKMEYQKNKIGRLKAPMIHDSLDDRHAWVFRHKKYARWEKGMNEKNAWPRDPIWWRQWVKSYLRHSRFRPNIMFFMSFIVFGGFLDGNNGLKFAKNKQEYYTVILETK